MANRIGGSRRKSKQKFSKDFRRKGKISLSRYFAVFNTGDRVVLEGEPAVIDSLYHARFHGLKGTIKTKVGRCYQVKIKDGNKEKIIITHPVHLKRL